MARKSKTSIKAAFDNVLANYLRARLKPFGREHALWKIFEKLAAHFEEHVSTRSTLRVKWSVGKGNWTRVPWLAFLDNRETNSTQYGLYPVYLFREDGSGVYLALNQGINLLKEKHGTPESRRILRERGARLLPNTPLRLKLKRAGFMLDGGIDLFLNSGLEKDHEASVIGHKLYRRGEIPPDSVLLRDLEKILLAYDECLSQQSHPDVGLPALVAPRPPREKFQISSAIHEVINYIADQGFTYQPWQIAQYVTAVRTKPLVILAGISGTGKSKLPALVAEATGGKAKLLPVRPDWTDSSDTLGYTNLEGNLQPGPVLELAHEATANGDQFFTCILDEMNLARVEHYFAEVLSKIEDRKLYKLGGYRSGPLLNQTLKEADAEWAEVGLPENLALVGTVNIDETTYGFSRKVVDRAFTMELSEIDLTQWRRKDRKTTSPAASIWPVRAWHPINIRLPKFDNPTADQVAEIERAIGALRAINTLLAPARLHVGYRTGEEVAFYLLHARQIADAFVDRDGNAVDPLDLALQMKILPRIAGGSDAIKRCVLGLLGWAVSEVALHSADEVHVLLEPWESAGRPASFPDAKHPRLAASLGLMWQPLEANESTSYWL